MKEEALALLDNVSDPAKKLNVLREYLQVLALRSLHESEASLLTPSAIRSALGVNGKGPG